MIFNIIAITLGVIAISCLLFVPKSRFSDWFFEDGVFSIKSYFGDKEDEFITYNVQIIADTVFAQVYCIGYNGGITFYGTLYKLVNSDKLLFQFMANSSEFVGYLI